MKCLAGEWYITIYKYNEKTIHYYKKKHLVHTIRTSLLNTPVALFANVMHVLMHEKFK